MTTCFAYMLAPMLILTLKHYNMKPKDCAPYENKLIKLSQLLRGFQFGRWVNGRLRWASSKYYCKGLNYLLIKSKQSSSEYTL